MKVLHAHQGAGLALPGGVEEMLRRIDDSRGHRAQGAWCSPPCCELKQVCNHPAQFLGDGSAARRTGRASSSGSPRCSRRCSRAGERALVFTQFAEMGACCATTSRSASAAEVRSCTAACPRPQRDADGRRVPGGGAATRRSCCSRSRRAARASTSRRANHVFHFDRWWNPAVENQATDRAFRIGQTPQRPGAQAGLRRHAGGEDRRR